MKYNYLKYYNSSDLSTGHFLLEAEQYLDIIDEMYVCHSINDAIALHNIHLCLKQDNRLSDWDEEKYAIYLEKNRLLPRIITRFFNQIDDDTIEDFYDQVVFIYKEDFWEIISSYKIYERISKNIFSVLLDKETVLLRQILLHKKLAEYYDQEITSYMIQSEDSSTLLLDVYLREDDGNKKYYMPKSLTLSDKESIIKEYVLSGNANPNYLRLIANSQDVDGLKLDVRIRRDAKRKYDESVERMFSQHNGFSYGVEVIFKENDFAVSDYYDNENHVMRCIYDATWISENLDYATLLNNFIYLFGYVDEWNRCTFLASPKLIGIFERILSSRGKNEYLTSMGFQGLQILSNIQMISYYQYLSKMEIEIEEIFQWFFEKYLLEEFHVKGFRYTPSSKNTTMLEKCTNLAPAIDSVLRQFQFYLEDGFVDRELLEMKSEHIFFKNIGSLVPKKYVYSNSKEVETEEFLLYSDQSKLHFVEKVETSYDNFVQLVLNEKIKKEDYLSYQQSSLDFLLEHNIVSIDEDGYLLLNKEKAYLLKELFENEYICYSYCGELQELIDEMVESEELRIGSTLLSESEQIYFNFILNRSEFSNGYDLKNKYSHGTPSLEPEINEQDYIELLKIMVLIILKINEEFCLINR